MKPMAWASQSWKIAKSQMNALRGRIEDASFSNGYPNYICRIFEADHEAIADTQTKARRKLGEERFAAIKSTGEQASDPLAKAR
jgi:hypothetical protein